MLGITVVKGATIKVYCFSANSSNDPTVEWYDSEGTKVATASETINKSGSTLTCITFTATEAGTYYVGTSENSTTQINIYGVIIDYA